MMGEHHRLIEAERIAYAYQIWENLRASWRAGVYNYTDLYPCERCRHFHFRDSKIGIRHKKYLETPVA